MTISETILQGWTVLIIDDDLKSLYIMKKLIQHYGAAAHLAENGQEGLEKISETTPDFIIADLSMPVMDGWELIKELQENRATAGIPIFALTAHAMVGDREKAIAAGFDNYLTKPLKPATFINELVALLVDIPIFAERLG